MGYAGWPIGRFFGLPAGWLGSEQLVGMAGKVGWPANLYRLSSGVVGRLHAERPFQAN